MATSTILIVFFAVAAILILVILAALTWALLDKRSENRHAEADKIRDQASEDYTSSQPAGGTRRRDRRQQPRRPDPSADTADLASQTPRWPGSAE